MTAVLSAFLLGLALVSLSAAQQMAVQAPVSPRTGTLALPRAAATVLPPALQQQQGASELPVIIPQQVPSTYLLGPDDQITVHVLDAEEISDKPSRIDTTGYIRLPLAGRIKAAGLTVEKLENEIAAQLRKYIREPEVSVSVIEFRSQPVSIIGSVKSPGVHQLEGRKTLVECLSLAGGVDEDAGYSVKITRRIEWGPIPLSSAVTDPTGRFSVADVNIEAIMAARVPAENITIFPEDIISVPRGKMVYVIGTVPRAGGYILHEKQTLSVLQALSLAGGLDHYAAPQNARILRPAAGNGSRIEIPVNLKSVLDGQAGDVPLQAEDILLIPSSAAKKAWARAAEAAIQIGTFSVYRF
jgi:polysaccharide biosynthesis/export protein